MHPDWVNALIGGILIGLSVSVMLYLSGRVTGISGILNGVLVRSKDDVQWRLFFLSGLLFGGIILNQLNPSIFENKLQSPLWSTVVAGLLVGFGTIMGSGCTSGHGVCGISRLSMRSLLATCVFIASGILSVVVFRYLGILP